MDLRLAVPADLDPIRAVFRRSALHDETDRDWLLANPHHLEWDGAPIADGRTWVVVDGGILGFATWESQGENRELVDLFVDPSAMRRGVGRRLVERIVGLGGTLEVTGNPEALPFYLSVGFRVIGEAPTERRPAPRLRYAR